MFLIVKRLVELQATIMLKLAKMIVDFKLAFFIVFTLRLQCKGAAVKTPVIVKIVFLQEEFEIFGCVACKLFEVFYEMSLVKEIVFVTDFSQ